MGKRLIIDTHTHFGVRDNKLTEQLRTEDEYRARVVLEDIEKLKERVGFGGRGLVKDTNLLEDYLQCMEENGISMSWIHQLSFKHILGYEILSNEVISEAVKKYPNKFKGFASVDVRKGKDAVKEFEYAMNCLGLHGLKLNPNDYGGFYLNDRELLYPLYEKCCEYKIPLSLHTGITPGSVFRMKHNYPLLIDDIAVDFPELVIIVEHMGYPWNDLCYNMVARHKNMFVTVTAVANILIHTKPTLFLIELAKMISQLGSEKILWGSDWTATPNVSEVLKFMDKLKIPLPIKIFMRLDSIKDGDIDNILGRNALRILR